MALKFEKFQSPGKGNGLRATSPLSPGDLLYIAEPFAYTVDETTRGVVCELCLRKSDHLLRCSQCKFAKYCDARCQREAWPDHKRECKCLKSIPSKKVIDQLRLVGKVILKLLQRLPPCSSEELYSTSELAANVSEQMKEALKHLEMPLWVYLKEEVDPSQFPADLNLTELIAKVTCNRFAIYNGHMNKVGVGLYPSMSLLNHSCDPNCVIVFEGRLLHLRARREIQVGEELTTSYAEPGTTSERQHKLRHTYDFECGCPLCLTLGRDEDMLAGDKKASDETKELVSTVEGLQSEKKWEEILALSKTRLTNNVGQLPDTNFYQMRLLRYAMDACGHLGRTEEALLYGSRTLEPYKLYYPAFHPMTAVQLMNVGILQSRHGKLREALQTMTEAVSAMKVSHGRDHSLTQELLKMLQHLEAWSRAAAGTSTFKDHPTQHSLN